MLSIDGLISGLKTDTIIDGLVRLQQARVERLNLRKSEIQAKKQALQGIEARLLSLRAQMSQLNRSVNNVFSSRKVQTSHEAIVSASANHEATLGSFSLRVIGRAQAHQIASQGFANSSQEITTGVISFKVGDRPISEITIDHTNNTVAGLVQAINSQSPDVVASIVRDPSAGLDRILITSKHTGAANQIVINNQLADSHGNAIKPDFSGPDLQTATNAIIQLGSGPGAITAEFATNQVDSLIQGVTLNLHAVDPQQDVVVTVSRDTARASQAVKEFVDEYNALISHIQEQTKYHAETQIAGPLLGHRSVSLLTSQLSSMVTSLVPGLGNNLNRLAQIGITIDGRGKLTLNSARLEDVLQGKVNGVNSDQVQRLFGLTAESSVPGIEFVLGSSRTRSSVTPYQVNITQAAERAVLIGSAMIDNTVVIDGSNDQFTVAVDGVQSESLRLTHGTYTPQQLARHLEAVINASARLGKRQVVATIDNGKLKITSLAYGATSKISDFAGTALAPLGLTGTETAVGKDVAGHFIVQGVVEPATGSGRILIGNVNNKHTADLQLRVTLDPTQVNGGVEGEITVTRGATAMMDQFLADFVDSTKGNFATAKASFDSQFESIEQSIDRVNRITTAKREYLLKQFAALERALSVLQTTSSVIANQLANLQQR